MNITPVVCKNTFEKHPNGTIETVREKYGRKYKTAQKLLRQVRKLYLAIENFESEIRKATDNGAMNTDAEQRLLDNAFCEIRSAKTEIAFVIDDVNFHCGTARSQFEAIR